MVKISISISIRVRLGLKFMLQIVDNLISVNHWDRSMIAKKTRPILIFLWSLERKYLQK